MFSIYSLPPRRDLCFFGSFNCLPLDWTLNFFKEESFSSDFILLFMSSSFEVFLDFFPKKKFFIYLLKLIFYIIANR